MIDYLKLAQSQQSLVSSFGTNQTAPAQSGPVGLWDYRGFPRDATARKLYLGFYQGKKTARMRTPEEIFAEPIRLKVLKIVRRRGKGPQVVWL